MIRKSIKPIDSSRAKLANKLWGDGLFIRFGRWPKNERSAISYAWGDTRYTHEPGVSVYPTRWDRANNRWAVDTEKQQPQSLETASKHYLALAASHPQSPFYQPRKTQHDAFIVTGTIVGIGTDGEPLLRNIQVRERVSCKKIYVPDLVFDIPEHCETQPNPKAKKKVAKKSLKKKAKKKAKRKANPPTLVAVKDLPPKLKKALRANYKGREVELEVASTFDPSRIRSHSESVQGYITAVSLLTGKYNTEFGSFGGRELGHIEERADLARGQVNIPMNGAIIIGRKGYWQSATIIARPENIAAFLPGKVDLTPYEVMTFYLLVSSSGKDSRARNFRAAAKIYPEFADTFKESVKSIQEKGLLRISKNDRVTLTTAGKNYNFPWGRKTEFSNMAQYLAHHGIRRAEEPRRSAGEPRRTPSLAPRIRKRTNPPKKKAKKSRGRKVHATFSKWIDAQKMEKRYPETFHAPDIDQLRHDVGVGDFVQWNIGAERVWMIVLDLNEDEDEIAGLLDNEPIDKKYQVGDVVRIKLRHVYDYERGNRKSRKIAEDFLDELVEKEKSIKPKKASKKKAKKKAKKVTKRGSRKKGNPNGTVISLHPQAPTDRFTDGTRMWTPVTPKRRGRYEFMWAERSDEILELTRRKLPNKGTYWNGHIICALPGRERVVVQHLDAQSPDEIFKRAAFELRSEPACEGRRPRKKRLTPGEVQILLRGPKKNPKKAGKKVARQTSETISETEFWKQVGELGWPSFREKVTKNEVSFEGSQRRLVKKKSKTYWKAFNRKASVKRDFIVERLGLAGDFGSDFGADIVGHGKRMYERVMVDPAYGRELLESKKYGIESFFYMTPTIGEWDEATFNKEADAEKKRIEKLKKPSRKKTKKKASKKKAKKGGTPKLRWVEEEDHIHTAEQPVTIGGYTGELVVSKYGTKWVAQFVPFASEPSVELAEESTLAKAKVAAELACGPRHSKKKTKKKATRKTPKPIPDKIIITRDELLLTEAYKLMREEEKRTGKPSSIDKFWDIAVAKHKPTAKELIAECRMFWEVYCKKPLKANLLQVADHCEAMKASKAKSVKAERQRCMRAVRAEAKSRGWKL